MPDGDRLLPGPRRVSHAPTAARPAVPSSGPGSAANISAGWWHELTPALAVGQPQVVIGHWRAATGRVEYDEVAPLPPVPPSHPAALRVYDDAGMAQVLWLDFDPDRAVGAVAAVDRDATAAARLIRAHGGRVIEDTTARGGRHVIVPLAAPASKRTLEPILRGLANRYPTLDLSPTLNVGRGCMAPPGALTRRGERRQLLTPPAEARAAVLRRSHPGLLDALRLAVAPPVDDAPSAPTYGAPLPVIAGKGPAVPSRARPLPALARGIVERGIYPTDRYRSGSEARMGALVAAAGNGWRLAEILQRATPGGAWPGLANLYAKYGSNWKKALTADWAKALLYAAHTPARRVVAQANTRGKITSRGAATPANLTRSPDATRAEQRFLRRAYASVKLASREWARDEHGWTRLAVILASIAHAHRSGSRVISPGTRSLTMLAGLMDHSTIAAVLRAEHHDPDGWIRLLERGRGDQPDRYELVIPQRYATLMDGRPLPTGRLEAVHPIFAPGLLAPGVGLAAWQVIDAVAGGAPTVPRVMAATGVSRAHAYRVLRAARQAGLLAQRVDGNWRRTRRSLDRAGRHVGLAERVAHRRQRYDIQRRRWRMWLADRGRRDWRTLAYRLMSGGTATPEQPPLWPPGWERHRPPDDPDPPARTPTATTLPHHPPATQARPTAALPTPIPPCRRDCSPAHGVSHDHATSRPRRPDAAPCRLQMGCGPTSASATAGSRTQTA